MKSLIVAAALAASALPAVAQPAPRKTAAAPAPAAPSDAPDCAAMGTLAANWNGQAYAIDGDTLAGVGLKPHLRLWGIQAPELRDGAKAVSVAGMRARAALEDLLEQSSHRVKCRAIKFDRDCHMVAQCSLDDAQAGDIGSGLIAAGMAYGFNLDEAPPWESRASQRYATAEAEARKQRRGLWKDWLGER